MAGSLSSFPGEEGLSKLEDGIALCMSGGGYRAMVFHLGALIRLNEAGLLRQMGRFQCFRRLDDQCRARAGVEKSHLWP